MKRCERKRDGEQCFEKERSDEGDGKNGGKDEE